MLTLVVARARDGAIGLNGTIPWDAPEDLAFFQRETLGGAVIMGRRTWESLPRRPLPRRFNLVVSAQDVPGPDGCVRSVALALDAARVAGHARVYGIGGAGIYAALMAQADRLLITEVDLEIPGADTHFPAFDAADWRVTQRLDLRALAPRCAVTEYLRRVR